ncbi:MAG: hypothetical protein CVU00_06655 [Bacteroidetes bacterium HGW-Bacteroidetes-17]|jgi:hypothetical protein|nr:MAG: hypothetical protein CVU00_06655 [Bacteroidetes bacterium HGW-Bacteroidetes-17]
MRRINTSYLSNDECWGIQINGLLHCQNCKWTGISACEGKNIVKTHRNSKGYKIEDLGLNMNDYDPAFDKSKIKSAI